MSDGMTDRRSQTEYGAPHLTGKQMEALGEHIRTEFIRLVIENPDLVATQPMTIAELRALGIVVSSALYRAIKEAEIKVRHDK